MVGRRGGQIHCVFLRLSGAGFTAAGVAKPAFKHTAAINTACCVGTMQSSFIHPAAVLYGKVQIKSITLL